MKLYEGNGYDVLFNLLLTEKISIDNISNIFILLIRLFNHNRMNIYIFIYYLLFVIT